MELLENEEAMIKYMELSKPRPITLEEFAEYFCEDFSDNTAKVMNAFNENEYSIEYITDYTPLNFIIQPEQDPQMLKEGAYAYLGVNIYDKQTQHVGVIICSIKIPRMVKRKVAATNEKYIDEIPFVEYSRISHIINIFDYYDTDVMTLPETFIDGEHYSESDYNGKNVEGECKDEDKDKDNHGCDNSNKSDSETNSDIRDEDYDCEGEDNCEGDYENDGEGDYENDGDEINVRMRTDVDADDDDNAND